MKLLTLSDPELNEEKEAIVTGWGLTRSRKNSPVLKEATVS